MTDRHEFTAGLRLLADLLDDNPDLPLPYTGSGSELLWIATSSDDHKALAQTFTRAIPGMITKNVRGTDFDLIGSVAGVGVQLIVDRDAVCKRVVVGTETVTREVPDPNALAAVPTTTVTETVEKVEWRCEPILTGGAS